MLGSIIGDTVGSIYEFDNIKTKDFEFFTDEKEFTDDSILTLATADWLLNGGDVANYYAQYAERYPRPMGGYGTGFQRWVIRFTRDGYCEPYNSCGNGSAMRVGPVGWAFDTVEETLDAAKRSAECTHNHPEGVKGAQATALAIFMARHGADKEDIRNAIETQFAYDLHFTCDDIRPTYGWGATCQDTVPQAVVAALDGTDFEDAVRNAVSIGGDSDTVACITGSIAEAIFGIPQAIYDQGIAYLSRGLKSVVTAFEAEFGTKIC